MAPSAERNVAIDVPAVDNYVIPRTNITFAVNYEVQMVDQFLASEKKRQVRMTHLGSIEDSMENSNLNQAQTYLTNSKSRVGRTAGPFVGESSLGSCTMNTSYVSNAENNAPSVQQLGVCDAFVADKQSVETPDDKKRRSTRGIGRREANLARSRVRYDMKLVPFVKRNKAFLSLYPLWWLKRNVDIERHARRLTSDYSIINQAPTTPFEEDSSIVWLPSKRMQWEDSISEMTALCTSAAAHRGNLNDGTSSTSTKIIHPPLSREYIKDRIDIDDPLYGFQIRCKSGGWLQGFILFTNFTTWTHDFKWDSLHPMSGVTQPNIDGTTNSKIDMDGSLASELEAQPREGDPQGTGIVFSGIAEIGLVGALGCGEYLLRMALDSIYEKEQFKFVVLQATEQSKSFYEEFGFIRVGSICRYGSGLLPPEDDTPISGYRHWTHANESEQSLQKHGGPSYMMCLKLPDRDIGKPLHPKTLFLSEMMKLHVDLKPRVENLGTTMTPSSKANRRGGTGPVDSSSNFENSSSRNRSLVRRQVYNSNVQMTDNNELHRILQRTVSAEPVSDEPESVESPLNTSNLDLSTKRSLPKNDKIHPRLKRRKVDALNTDLSPANGRRLHVPVVSQSGVVANPLDEKLSTYYRNQYNSVWLAVPIKPVAIIPRQAPKERTSADNTSISEREIASEFTKVVYSNECSPDEGSNLNHTFEKCHAGKVKKNSKSKTSRSKVLTPKTKKASKLSPSESKDRTYHSIRGPDGKFVRVEVGSQSPNTNSKTISPIIPVAGKKLHNPIDRTTLMKQKVKSYPRSRLHYFNRVVKPKQGSMQYYFVLNFDEQKDLVRLVPMQARGVLSGKREGRPRYQAIIGETDSNFITVEARDYVVVNSAMVMKTPIVASEAWDIEDD